MGAPHCFHDVFGVGVPEIPIRWLGWRIFLDFKGGLNEAYVTWGFGT